MGEIINCKAIREDILDEVKEEISSLGIKPKLVIISIGHDDASEIYMRNKIKTAKSVGIDVDHVRMDDDICQREAEQVIEAICSRSTNHAVMLQLPIPKHLDKDKLINVIPQHKDVDGLTDLNMGMLVNNRRRAIVPATAMGVYEVIKRQVGDEDLSRINVSVVNRSQLIGKPLQALLTNHNATVTLMHSRSQIYNDVFINSNFIVLGTGQPKWFSDFYIYDYHTIIDCSMCRDENNKLCGDANIELIEENNYNANFKYTPVPSGVGILTTACLMRNVVKCYLIQNGEF